MRINTSISAVAVLLWIAAVSGVSSGQTSITLEQAIQATLASDADVLIEKARLAQRQAVHRVETGRFDWRLLGAVERSSFNRMSPLGYSLQAIESNRESYSLGVHRPFRNGLVLQAGTQVIHTEFSQLTPRPLDIADTRLTLTLPLLRGRGTAYAAADERTAFVDMQGAHTLYTQRVADQIAVTTLAFYDCLTADQELRILQAAEQQAKDVENLIRSMVTARRMLEDNLFPATATAIIRRKERRTGEAELERRRRVLAAAIGIPYDQTTVDPPVAQGVLPTPKDTLILNQLSGIDFTQRAVVRRGDYLNRLTAVESARLRLTRADHMQKPRLDLQAAVGYTGYAAAGGRFESLHNRASGPSASVGLRLDLPIRRTQAKGEVAYRQALLDEAQHRSDRLLQQISTDIYTVVGTLREAVTAYHDLEMAEQHLQKALQLAIEKLPLERTTAGNVMLLHNQLLDLRMEKTRTAGLYAGALVQLRLVTGTLLDQDTSITAFDVKRLTSLPFSE